LILIVSQLQTASDDVTMSLLFIRSRVYRLTACLTRTAENSSLAVCARQLLLFVDGVHAQTNFWCLDPKLIRYTITS